jgi:phenylpyruvate tautomerase PptA (4-oxalocrotonate tautomerase family)
LINKGLEAIETDRILLMGSIVLTVESKPKGEIHMPICFIEAPAIRTETKTKLVEQTTDALREAYQLDDYRVFIREYPPENVAQDGHLQTEIRPISFIEGPRIRMDIKRKLVERLSAVLKETYHVQDIMIFLREYPLENVGLRGRLQSENPQVVEVLKQLVVICLHPVFRG